MHAVMKTRYAKEKVFSYTTEEIFWNTHIADDDVMLYLSPKLIE